MKHAFLRGVMIAGACLSCAHSPPDASCEGAVNLWIDSMEGALEDPRKAKAAYQYLGPKTRANLEERARRASQTLGRTVDPTEILAGGHFGLRFRPKKFVMQGGNLVITGDDPTLEQAVVECTREGDRAKVEPGIPDPPPVFRSRDGGF